MKLSMFPALARVPIRAQTQYPDQKQKRAAEGALQTSACR
jgi:hypothetical protein